MVMDDLLRRLRNVPIYSQAYADDIMLLARGIDLGTLRSHIRRALSIVSAWAGECGLTVNASKTQAVMFTWKRKWDWYPFSFNGENFKLLDTVRYLGVTLANNLNWTPHIREKSKKCKIILMRCMRATGRIYGHNPKVTPILRG